jgi:NAD(P)-dependent dehydrogenase (short-subunit alcohol dehydrogenase family)
MGAAVVEQVSALGAEVHVLDRREPPLEVASFQDVDLTDPQAMAAAVDAVGGRIDALFNCVGVPGAPRFTDVETMLVNFVGVRYLTELVAARMPPGGAVATISSAAGAGWAQRLDTFLPLLQTAGFDEARGWCLEHPDDIAGGYVASKLAVAMWTAYACDDLGARGIRINCTGPGPTETPMLPDFKQKMEEGFWETFPIPLGRFSTPAEQARPLVFLNSNAASCITGAFLVTDGGTVAAATADRIALPAPRLRAQVDG